MSVSKIQTAIEKRLNAMNPKPAISWPNVPFTPQGDQPFIEVKFQTSFLEDTTLDRTGYMKQDVLAILDVYVPIGTATGVLRNWLDALETQFPRTLVLTESGVQVVVRERQRNTMSTGKTWVVQGLTIKVFAIHD